MDIDYSITRLISKLKKQRVVEGDCFEKEYRLNQEFLKEHDFVENITPGGISHFISVLKLRFDVKNLKLLIRHFVHPLDIKRGWFLKTETFSTERIDKVFSSSTFEEAVFHLRKTRVYDMLKVALRDYYESPRLPMYDASLNKYHSWMCWKAALKTNDGIRHLLGTRYDLVNMNIILHGKDLRKKVEFSSLRNYLLPVHHHLGPRDITQMVRAKSVAELKEVIRKTKYKQALGNPELKEQFEDAFEKYFTMQNHEVWKTKISEAIPYAYLNLLEKKYSLLKVEQWR